MWLKNLVNWAKKEAQKWESMALERCVTGIAYDTWLMLQGINERKDTGDAAKLFRNWFNWMHAMLGQTGELFEPMARDAPIVKGHLEGILPHSTRGLMTTLTEGFNTLFPAVKRKARGYRTVEYMTAMLYFVAGKLTLPCY
jgi:transposase